jgi:hypothetical protein
MRSFLLAATAAPAFAATMTFESTSADAVVRADGVVRAACAGPRGTVVVKKPVAVPLGGGERRQGPPLHLI